MRGELGAHFGDYTVVRRLGVGAMAEVYLCQLEFDDPVVIRRIRPELLPDPELVASFLDEARVAGSLDHPNIVQVREIVEAGGMPYVVMEYVRGPTLARIIRAIKGHTPRYFGELALIGAAVCRALDHAHRLHRAGGKAQEIVHGEVSTRNIVVTDEGVPKLLDFGLARARARLADSLAPEALADRAAYVSPEQLGGGVVDHRADVFALGACLYHASTGQLPFAGQSPREMLAARRSGARAPSLCVPDYPPQLEALVMGALAHDPARRSSAGELASLLEDFAVSPDLPRETRPVADFVEHLLVDFDEPFTFGSDDGYLSQVVPQALPRASRATVPRVAALTPARRRRKLWAGAVIAGAVVGGVLGGVLLMQLFGDRKPAAHATGPVAAALPSGRGFVVSPAAPEAAVPDPPLGGAVAPSPAPTPNPAPRPAPAPSPAPAAALVAAPRLARLSVSTLAGASVFLDDVRIGRAPLRHRSVAAGAHVVVVEREGFAPERRTVNLAAGAELSLQIALSRARKAAAPVKRADAAPGSTESEPAAPIASAAEPVPRTTPSPAPAAPPPEPARPAPPSPAPPATPPPTPAPAPAAPAPARPRPVVAAAPAVRAAAPAPEPLKKVAVPTPLYLPASYAVRNEGELDKILAKVEREAVTVGKAPAGVVKGVTRGLGARIRARLAGPPVEIRPVEIYTLIVRGALQGRSPGSLAGALLQLAPP